MDRNDRLLGDSPAALTEGRPDRDAPIRFAGFRLDQDGSLYRGDTLLHLPPRELAALRVLLAHAGQIVSPTQLKQALWGNVHVTADSVPRCLSSLRARLQPDDCIQTVYKRGYRLLAEVLSGNAPTGVAPHRLAIAPFTAGAGVPEHLGMAVAEEIIARLSNAAAPLISVLARDSVFSLAQAGASALKVGETLQADLVLTGTLRAFPAHLRLRAEMIRVSDGVQIWVEDMLVERARIMDGESELVSRLYFRLNLDVNRSGAGQAGEGDQFMAARPAAGKPEDGEQGFAIAASAEPASESASNRRQAFELYLRGHHEWQTLERHRMQDGLQHLSRAIELDPSLIAAKIDLVHLCVTQSIYGFMAPAVAAELVQRTADSIDDLPRMAERLLPALAWIQFHFKRDWPAALRAFALSARLPHDPLTTRMRTLFALSRHRFQEAIDLLRAAIDLDPYAPWLQNRLAWALHLNGEADQSVAQIEHTLQAFPDHQGTALYGAKILAFHGDAARAIPLAENLVQREPYFDLAYVSLAYAVACAGRAAEARGILERLEWLSNERFVMRSFTPAVHLALGDPQAALTELRAANELRCPWFFQTLADPRLKPLHGHPEFEHLRRIHAAMEASGQASSPLQA